MADIIPPGYGEVLVPFKHSSLARSAVITFGLALSDVPLVSDLNSITLQMESSFGPYVDDSVMVGPAVMRVGQDGGEALVISGTDTFTGNRSGSSALNGGQAVLVHKRTSRGGRRGRGRMYIPWMTADTLVNEIGVLDSTERAALQTAVETWAADVLETPKFTDFVVLHSPSAPDTENPTVPGEPNVITSWVVDPIVGTQRRRLGRV